jgi:photosystem II stability/assembly factor-like uncharacterized protein
MVNPITDILDLAVANDGSTCYAVVQAEQVGANTSGVQGHPNEAGAQEVWRTTNGGESWVSRSPTTSNTSRVRYVAVAPDDPAVVVAAGTVNVSGTMTNYVWISFDKG